MEEKKKRCGCRQQKYPDNVKCLTESLVYKATVKTEKHTKFYVGSTGLSFKDRQIKHTYSFRNEKYCNDTTNRSTYGISKTINLIIKFLGKY